MSNSDFLFDVAQELENARSKFPDIASLHEGYAIILEETDELWEQIRLKANKRDHDAMRKELVQIAAMAMRTAEDLF